MLGGLSSWIVVLVVLVGFVCLLKGADWLVDGASVVARQSHVSDLVIGLTIVALGTSLPEFIVSILAAAEHKSELSITNVLGSNMMNIFLVLGLAALISPISSEESSRKFDLPFSAFITILVLLFLVPNVPSWCIGGLLLGLLGYFLWRTLHRSRDACRGSLSANPVGSPQANPYRAVFLILVGCVGLVLGGRVVVDGACEIAHRLHVSEGVIGLTIVAMGTSLPECVTSCVAAYRHNSGLALGNVLGSNIFNILLVLGISAVIHPLAPYEALVPDTLVALTGSLLVMLFLYLSPKRHLTRLAGGVLVTIYLTYLVYRLLMV